MVHIQCALSRHPWGVRSAPPCGRRSPLKKREVARAMHAPPARPAMFFSSRARTRGHYCETKDETQIQDAGRLCGARTARAGAPRRGGGRRGTPRLWAPARKERGGRRRVAAAPAGRASRDPLRSPHVPSRWATDGATRGTACRGGGRRGRGRGQGARGGAARADSHQPARSTRSQPHPVPPPPSPLSPCRALSPWGAAVEGTGAVRPHVQPPPPTPPWAHDATESVGSGCLSLPPPPSEETPARRHTPSACWCMRKLVASFLVDPAVPLRGQKGPSPTRMPPK